MRRHGIAMGRTAGIWLPALAAGFVLAWFVGTEPRSTAKADDSASSSRLLTVVKDVGEGMQAVYVIDAEERTLCVYQFDARKNKIKLAAARHLKADQQLLEFNNEEPHVTDIEKLLKAK